MDIETNPNGLEVMNFTDVEVHSDMTLTDQVNVEIQIIEAEALTGPEVVAVADALAEMHSPLADPVGTDFTVVAQASDTLQATVVSYEDSVVNVKELEVREKHNIGNPFTETVDLSGGSVIAVKTFNFGKSADGTYSDPNVAASVWVNGEFLGEGLSRQEVLDIALERGLITDESELEKVGNDLKIALVLPDGTSVQLGQLNNVEGYGGKITEGNIDIAEVLKANGVDINQLDLSNVQIEMQEVGAGWGSLDERVEVQAVTTSTTSTTTTVPATTSTTTTSTTEVPATTSTTTTVPEVAIIPPETTVPETTSTTVAPALPPMLAETGVNHGDIGFVGATLALGGLAFLLGQKARKIMTYKPSLVHISNK